ncbi:MAG TPA: ferritin-like domain-containing protein [Novosphingobium sp.]|nr:ferritin-like domain-containing protein [Novosphingobium sp.]
MAEADLQTKPAFTFTDNATLRAKARKQIGEGPVTTSYPDDRDTIVAHLNAALATEWVCVLRYMRHYFCATGFVSEPIKAHFLEHAKEEQAHANALAERIVQLGGEPDLNPDGFSKRAHAEYKEGKTLKDMIREDLIAERIAIEAYKELIAYVADRDPTTRVLLEGILKQEEEHADEFRDLLEGWEGE